MSGLGVVTIWPVLTQYAARVTHLLTHDHSLNHSPPPPHPSLPPPTLPLQVLLVIELLAKTDLKEHLISLRPRSATPFRHSSIHVFLPMHLLHSVVHYTVHIPGTPSSLPVLMGQRIPVCLTLYSATADKWLVVWTTSPRRGLSTVT